MRSDGEETQKRLLLAAGKVFAEKGFKKATNQDIANLARANGAAISYYFRDKAGLYLGVWNEAQSRSKALYSEWIEIEDDGDDSIFRQGQLARLKQLMRCLYDWACDEESRDSLMIFDEMAEESGVLSSFREDMVLRPLLQEMKKVLGYLLEGESDAASLQKLLPHLYLSSIRGFCERNAPEIEGFGMDELYDHLERMILQRVEAITGSQSTGKSSSFIKRERAKLDPPISQLELGVTDEVAFELKHPTREEIILQEELAKARIAEEEQSKKVDVLPLPVISPEEQLELF